MNEQVEESGIDEDPQDVSRTLDLEALAQPATLRDQVADDTTGTDPTFRPIASKTWPDLGIRAGRTAVRLRRSVRVRLWI